MLPDTGISRRKLLLLASGSGLIYKLPLAASNSDFWNKKEPAQWSTEEIDKLVTRSPWAKQVMASAPANRQYGGSSSGGMGDPGIGGAGGGGVYPAGMGYPSGIGGGQGRGGGGRNSSAMPTYTATVRWESAKPVQEALKTPLPDKLAGDYVISVGGVPVLTRGRERGEDDNADNTVSHGLNDDVLDRIKALTYLEPKGKPPAQPGLVQKGSISSNGNPVILFGFSHEVLSLTADDHDVLFTTKLGAMEIKAKFNLKDMLYRGALSL